MTIEYDPHGREGIGLAQSQSGIDFPLVAPSDDIRYLIADFYLAYDDPADYDATLDAFTPPFHIEWLYIYANGTPNSPDPAWSAPTHAADMCIKDANNQIVFETATGTYEERDWTDRLHIYQWRTAAAACRLVTHTKWLPDGGPTPREYPWWIGPENAVIDNHCIRRQPKRVKSLTAVLTRVDDGPVDFVAGNNMAMAYTGALHQYNRLVQQVTMGAVPGAGQGVVPGCTPASLVITKINETAPNASGAFQLSATGCYHIRQPATIVSASPRRSAPTPSMLEVGNDCLACCTCDDYVNLGLYMNDVGTQYQQLGSALQGYHAVHKENVIRWNVARDCMLKKPLRVALQPQICPFLDVAAQFVNQTDKCVGPIDFRIDFSGTVLGAGVSLAGFCFITGANRLPGTRGGLTERYDMAGVWPVFHAYADSINPYKTVTVRFRLQFDNCGGGDTPYTINVTVTALLNGVPLVVPDGTTAAAHGTAVLNCPAGGNAVFDTTICVTQP